MNNHNEHIEQDNHLNDHGKTILSHSGKSEKLPFLKKLKMF